MWNAKKTKDNLVSSMNSSTIPNTNCNISDNNVEPQSSMQCVDGLVEQDELTLLNSSKDENVLEIHKPYTDPTNENENSIQCVDDPVEQDELLVVDSILNYTENKNVLEVQKPHIDHTYENTSSSCGISHQIDLEVVANAELSINHSDVTELLTIETVLQSSSFDDNEDEVDFTYPFQKKIIRGIPENAHSSTYPNVDNMNEVIPFHQESISNPRTASKRKSSCLPDSIQNKLKKSTITSIYVAPQTTNSSNHSATDGNDTSFARPVGNVEGSVFKDISHDISKCLELNGTIICSNIGCYCVISLDFMIDEKKERPYIFPKYGVPTDVVDGNQKGYCLIIHYCYNNTNEEKKRLLCDSTLIRKLKRSTYTTIII